MKVELEIKDDKELRNLIKDMIKGQVVNVLRESLPIIINEEINKKHSYIRKKAEESTKELEKDTDYLEQLAIKEIKKAIPKKIDFEQIVKDEVCKRIPELLNLKKGDK